MENCHFDCKLQNITLSPVSLLSVHPRHLRFSGGASTFTLLFPHHPMFHRFLSPGIIVATLVLPVGASATSIYCPDRVCHSYDRNGSCNNYTCVGTDEWYGSTGYYDQYYPVNYSGDRCSRTNRYYNSSYCRRNDDYRYSDPRRYYDYSNYYDYLRYYDNRYDDRSNYDTNYNNRQACVRRCNRRYSSSYYYRPSSCGCAY